MSNMTLFNQRNSILNEFDNLFNGFLSVPALRYPDYNSNINKMEYDDKTELLITVPGLSKDELNIKLENDTLTVSSSVEQSSRKQVVNRSWTINPNIYDANKISAKLKDGILTIVIDKLPKAIPKTILIE